MVEPIHTGSAGKVWKVKLPDLPGATQIGAWLIEQPGVHAFWSRWFAILIHLRPVEGVDPALLQFPEATHELVIAALDPDSYGEHEAFLAGEKKAEWKWLDPLDVVQQFTVSSDAMALAVVDKHMDAIVRGHLSPDSDYRSRWEATLKATAEHFVAGKHGLA